MHHVHLALTEGDSLIDANKHCTLDCINLAFLYEKDTKTTILRQPHEVLSVLKIANFCTEHSATIYAGSTNCTVDVASSS